MHLLDILRRPETLERRQPNDPVVDVGVEPCRFAVQRIGTPAPHGKRHAAVVGKTVLLFQIGIAARQEIEVVERRKSEISRDGGLCHHFSAVRKHVIGEKGGNDRRPFVAEHLFAQRQRKAQPLRGLVFGRHVSRQLDAPLIVADLHLFAIAFELLRILHRKNILIHALDQMLMQGDIGREEPLAADGILPFDLTEEGVDLAARTDHLRQRSVSQRFLEVVGHPRMDVSRFSAHLPILADMVPLQDAAQRLFALHVGIVGILLVVDRQHRNAAFRMDVPSL